MKHINLLIALVAVAMLVNSCMQDDLGVYAPNDGQLATDVGSVITLTTDGSSGLINLSVDAPESSRADVWIDLNGDGVRAQDGAEDMGLCNSYQEYAIAAGLKTVAVYGAITYLGCASNELTAIDITRNPYLTTLNVPLNKLTTLDVSKNSALVHLDCSGNNIATLDVGKNSALVSLWAFNNKLSAIDLTNNRHLTSLDCSGNAISSLDVTSNSELVRLICFNNQLTTLDISTTPKLNRLWAFGNRFSDTEMKHIEGAVKEIGQVDVWISDSDSM